MDSQRENFAKLIASQFAYLTSNASDDTTRLKSTFDEFVPVHQKLHEFCESIIHTLVGPRHAIVAQQVGKAARHLSSSHDNAIVIDPTPEFPSQARFIVKHDFFIPEESIKFDYAYRITGSDRSSVSDDWIRFTIKTFDQYKFCEWLENGIVRFVNAQMAAARQERDI